MKAYRAGFQIKPRILTYNYFPSSQCERPNHQEIPFFINLICPSVSGSKVLNSRVFVLPYSVAVESSRTFRIRKIWSYKNPSWRINTFKTKKLTDTFFCLYDKQEKIYERKQTNSLCLARIKISLWHSMCNVSSDISTMDHWQWSLDMKLHTDLTAQVLCLAFIAFTIFCHVT